MERTNSQRIEVAPKTSQAPRQRGVALIVAVLLLALTGVTGLIALARGSDDRTERDKRTAEALSQAKAALIGYAAGRALSANNRFGDLPCPDTDNDGTAIVAATGLPENCAAQHARLGRLPWKSLGIADLRDGDGERLWYAVSVNFKNNPRTSCTQPTDSGCLNSDSRGTITIRDTAGALIHHGGNPDPHIPSGVIAVVIAPGAVIKRQGSATVQDRSTAGINDPRNYLDTALGEDNADFIDGADANGFIAGPVVDTKGTLLVNDRIAVITYEDVLPALEKRVAREVSGCLERYAAVNGGRYPFATDIGVSAFAIAGSFIDAAGARFGRIPDEPFTRTRGDSGELMSVTWPSTPCTLGGTPAWWTNWKLHTFYALAEAYMPVSPLTPPSCGVHPCLVITRPGSEALYANVRYAVLVAGRRLASVNFGQPRANVADRANVANYLERRNASPLVNLFEIDAPAITFNDTVVFQ
jgi:type II secretory pathway pseudopilin PulG